MFVDNLHVNNPLYKEATPVVGYAAAALMTMGSMVSGDNQEVRDQWKMVIWNAKNPGLAYRTKADVRRTLERAIRR